MSSFISYHHIPENEIDLFAALTGFRVYPHNYAK